MLFWRKDSASFHGLALASGMRSDGALIDEKERGRKGKALMCEQRDDLD